MHGTWSGAHTAPSLVPLAQHPVAEMRGSFCSLGMCEVHIQQ